MNNLLTIENVTKRYAAHTALNDVSLSVPQGSIYGLLGPNGAGKTTLIRVINRITLPDAGRVLFDGHAITTDDIYNIGYLPEERGLYKKMKVGEQAMFFARLKGLSRKEALKVFEGGGEGAEEVVRALRYRGLVGQEGRGFVERYGAEGAVYHHGAASPQVADFR